MLFINCPKNATHNFDERIYMIITKNAIHKLLKNAIHKFNDNNK